MILGVVFTSIALLIQYAYTEYDKVTGTMILEETLIHARNSHKEEKTELDYEDMGRQLGNPRLWLGDYEIEISMKGDKVSGKATAGEWDKEIEMNTFRPSTYLRQKEFLEELLKGGEENDEGEYRVQEGNESQLYGGSFGTRVE